MVNIIFIPLLLYLYFLGVTAQNEKENVSRDVFNSLEELSRLVDISYCVGTTGVQQPFRCLSRCSEFPDFELITVSAHYLHHEPPLNSLDMEHGDPPI
jgi:triacylglycerol lipase